MDEPSCFSVKRRGRRNLRSLFKEGEIDVEGRVVVEREKGELKDEFRIPWLWVEGWRARLRGAGDIVEKERWEWELDGKMRKVGSLVGVDRKVRFDVGVGR